jgi:hypothetical protein
MPSLVVFNRVYRLEIQSVMLIFPPQDHLQQHNSYCTQPVSSTAHRVDTKIDKINNKQTKNVVAAFAGSYVAIIKLSGWLFSRVLASHAGGPGWIPGRDMSVLGPLG